MESLRVGRDGYKRGLKLARNSDRISTQGRFIDAGEIRRSRPIPLKEPETRSAPPYSENLPGAGIVYGLIIVTLFWLAVVFLFCLEGR